MDFSSTVNGSLLEGSYPEGWDMKKIDECCSNSPESISERQPFWNKDFDIVPCENVYDFDILVSFADVLSKKNFVF